MISMVMICYLSFVINTEHLEDSSITSLCISDAQLVLGILSSDNCINEHLNKLEMKGK